MIVWCKHLLFNEASLKEHIADKGADDGSMKGEETRQYKLGRTYNRLAALEVMRGGDVRWDKAMLLFRKAVRRATSTATTAKRKEG